MTTPSDDATSPDPPQHANPRGIDKALADAGLYGLPTLAAIIQHVAGLRGKPIQLEQVGDNEWGTLTGLWVETPQVSRIFIRRTDPAGYQVVCALHEVIHILMRHPGCLPTAQSTVRLPGALRRARTADDPLASPGQAGFEADAEYGARRLAQSLLHDIEDPAEKRFG